WSIGSPRRGRRGRRYFVLFVLFVVSSIVVVLEIAPEAPLVFDIEDHARVDRTRVHVQAHSALVPLREVLDAMDGLTLVHRIQRPAGNAKLGAELLHLDARRAREAVHADDLLVLGAVAIDLAVVLDDKL